MRSFSLILLLLIGIQCYPQLTKKDSLLLIKIDSLRVTVDQLRISVSKSGNADTSILKIADKEIFKSSSSLWEKLLPALIALVTVSVSSLVAYKVGMRAAAVQATNAEKQAETQLAVASDQLAVSRDQITQTAKNTIEQVRANNLTEARLDWIKDLRPLLSELLPAVYEARMRLESYLGQREQQRALRRRTYHVKDKESEDQLKEIEQTMRTMEADFDELTLKIEEKRNQILLFLNPEFDSHKKLEECLNQFYKCISNLENTELDNIKEESNNIIHKARLVLTEAWNLADKEAKLSK